MPSYFISDEHTLAAQYHETLLPLIQQHGCDGTLTGTGGVAIAYRMLRHPQAKAVVLVVNGRLESFEKYTELFVELWHNGYSVISFDHRGQGRSGRLLDNPQVGHIDSYRNYVADLKLVVEQLVRPSGHLHPLMLCHSMGGCIGLHYLHDYPDHPFAALALCSPMLSINTGPFPLPLAKAITALWAGTESLLSRACHRQPGHFRWGGHYQFKPFLNNRITHSQTRFELMQQRYRALPQIQLGDPSAAWVARSFAAAATAIDKGATLKLPILLQEAGADPIVTAAGIRALRDRQPNVQWHKIEGARHELLFEADRYRQPVMHNILNFFASVCQQR